jgi:putative ABC transport system permease protein
MVKNYFIVVLRYFLRQRTFSIINIFGLTTGIACSLLILLYVQDELKYDTFHADADRIYRIGFQGKVQGKLSQTTLTGFPVAEKTKSEVKILNDVCRLAAWKTFPVKYESKVFTEDYLLLADHNFFQFFSFKLLEGDAGSVLTGDRKVVITRSAAKRIFGYTGKRDASPIGKSITLAQGYTAYISGIAEDPPLTSHFHFSLILSLSSWEKNEPVEWLNGKVITYFKIKGATDPQQTLQKVDESLRRNLNEYLTYLHDTNLEEYKKQGSELTYFFQPLKSIHLHSNLNDEIEANGNIDNIYLFGSIAIFITLLACINFMNLTTAQSTSRSKEVAVRKAVGAQNKRLITQFLIESYFYVVIAVIFAILILLVVLSPFNYFTGKGISISGIFNLPFISGIVTFILLTGLVAGSYPAFYLTHFSPVDVLKGALRRKARSYNIRNALVVFQFFISSGLIIATIIVYQQLQYIQQANLGFEKDKIINLLHTKNLDKRGADFKKELLKLSQVQSASYCNRLPPNIDWQSIFRPEGNPKDFSLAVYETDFDHLKTMGYTMKSGRFFSPEINDSLSVILNETAVAKMRMTNPEGKKIFSTYDYPAKKARTVIGVIQDFHFQSLKNPIQPLAIILGYEPNWEMAIRVKGNPYQAVTDIEKLFKKYTDGAAFEYSLVSHNFEEQLHSEKKVGIIFICFTTLAIIIACLGLFGLATFTAEQQRKEIGIRKVLGASITNIVALLNKEFLKLVVLANIIAIPVSGWLMNKWLDQFAYHTSISWWIFALSAVTTLIIALGSISFKAFRAASGNPVNSLRTE